MNERKRILKKRIKCLQKQVNANIADSKEYKKLMHELSAMTSNNMVKQAKIDDLESELKSERRHNALLVDANKDLKLIKIELEEKIKNTDGNRDYWYDQASSLAKRLGEKSDQLVELTKKKEAFEKKARILEAELKADKKIIADYTSEIDSQEEKVISLNKYILELKERIQELNKTIRDKDEIISDRTKDVKYWEDAYKNEKDKPLWKKVFRRG